VTDVGDELFEEFRAEADAAMRKKIGEILGSPDAEYHRAMYEVLSGRKLDRDFVLLNDLEKTWLALPGDRSEGYLTRVLPFLRGFVAFVKKRGARDMRDVTVPMVQRYVKEIEVKRKATTVNGHVSFLKSVFSRLGPDGGVVRNPFDSLAKKDEQTIHRVPLTLEEIELLINAAVDVVRGPIICGVNTAMRRADCCLLERKSVDLKGGFIEINTIKTGKKAVIPIFPMLMKELTVQMETDESKASVYVWPDAALMMKSNPSGISRRVKNAFKKAEIVSVVSVPGGAGRMQSVKDFHALKTTWITMALNYGIPMALVEKVCGNSSVKVVMKHYYQPAKDELRDKIGPAFAGFGGMKIKEKKNKTGKDLTAKITEIAKKA